jgi:hypothetical protein
MSKKLFATKSRKNENTKNKNLDFVLLNFRVFVVMLLYMFPKRHINSVLGRKVWLAFKAIDGYSIFY